MCVSISVVGGANYYQCDLNFFADVYETKNEQLQDNQKFKNNFDCGVYCLVNAPI